jgi:hypothetical protein
MKLDKKRKSHWHIGIIIGLLFISFGLRAQESTKSNDFQSQFDSFKNSINQEYNAFLSHNDSVFIQFLSQSWKEFDGIQNLRPVIHKPKTPMEVSSSREDLQLIKAPDAVILKDTLKIKSQSSPKDESPKDDNGSHSNIVKENDIKTLPADSLPKKATVFNTSSLYSSFIFYGSTISMPFLTSEVPKISAVNNDEIIHFFTSASNSKLINNTIKSLKENSVNSGLNDWGIASMIMTASKKIYKESNEQVLFTWFALIRNGYNAKIGYNKDQIYLLLPANEKIYTTSYLVKGIAYYLFDFNLTSPDAHLLSIYEADYPGSKIGFSFLLNEVPQFGAQYINKTIGKKNAIKFKVNKNLIEFYNNYPPCELKVVFNSPLSKSIMKQFDEALGPILKDKNDDERAAYLLNYVQQNINYQIDQEQFGREKYFFADETIFYPAADCEDRAILLSKLIKHFTNLETVGLVYPEHVSLAVNLNNVSTQKSFKYKNKLFYNCDPTYIGASCGQVMPKLANLDPEFVE